MANESTFDLFKIHGIDNLADKIVSDFYSARVSFHEKDTKRRLQFGNEQEIVVRKFVEFILTEYRGRSLNVSVIESFKRDNDHGITGADL